MLRIIPKIQVFLWKTLHTIIPTKINLISRFVDVDPFYLRCGWRWRRLSIFFEIVFGRIVFGSLVQFRLILAWARGGVVRQLVDRLDEETFCIFATFLWTLSFVRNLLVFQRKCMS